MEKKKENKGGKVLGLMASLMVPLLILLVRPIGLSLNQCVILAALVLAITWWVAGLVERTVTSVGLLAVFLLFSGAAPTTVFSFPLSETFLVVVFAFLFSKGVANSGLITTLLQPVMCRYVRSVPRLLASLILLLATMCFVIPQPLSRLLIIALIYQGFAKELKLSRGLETVLLLGIYYFSLVFNLALLPGDCILNQALMSISGVQIPETTWLHHMAVPTLGYLVLSLVLYSLVFRKTLAQFPKGGVTQVPKAPPLTAVQKRQLCFIAVAVVVWATESLHGISGTYVVMVATVLMFPVGLLRLPDLKAVNPKLLVFLTAAFSIGGTLKACGVADAIFSLFIPLFPTTFSWGYALLIVATVLVLHTILGSNITTMSVAIPGMLTITAGVVPVHILLFLMLITICSQYLLPFHSVALLLGEGSGHFTSRELVRISLPHSVIMIVAVCLCYLPWWQVQGLL